MNTNGHELLYKEEMLKITHPATLRREEAILRQAAADKILDALLPQESLDECFDPLTAAGNGHAEFSWGAAPVLALAYRCYQSVRNSRETL